MKTLRDIDLSDKANASAKHLSGGQKRKLSIGIAVIGDPKVFCDILSYQQYNSYFRSSFWTNLPLELILILGDICGQFCKIEDMEK